MAVEKLPDYHDLLAELSQLEQEERALSTVRAKLHDRIDLGFPNDLTIARERQVSDERRALHRRIDALRFEVAPFLRGEIAPH
jgi:hypothetical protein